MIEEITFSELNLYDKAAEIVVCASVKEDYVEECKAIWQRQAALINDTFTHSLVQAAFALLMLFYLCRYAECRI